MLLARGRRGSGERVRVGMGAGVGPPWMELIQTRLALVCITTGHITPSTSRSRRRRQRTHNDPVDSTLNQPAHIITHLPSLDPALLPHPEQTETPTPNTMRAFLLVALLACLALASAFVPRAALPKKAAVAVRSKLAPFQRCVGVSRACMYVFVCRSSS